MRKALARLATLVFAVVGAGAYGQQSLPAARVVLDDGAATVNVPFHSYRQWMILEARVAGSEPLQFILDSGAPVVVLASRQLGETLPLQIVGQARLGGADDGAPKTVPLAGDVTVELDGATITNASMAVGAAADTIAGMDGIFGGALFRELVVEIDWAASELTLHDPRQFEYTGTGIELPLLLLPSGHLITETTVHHAGVAHRARLLVDTGAGHALSLEPTLVTPTRALGDVVIGWGANGVARGDVATIDRLEIGSTELLDVVTSFPAGGPWTGIGASQNEVIHGNLGQRVLRRFDVIFDVPGGRLILEPGTDVNAPFVFDTTGMALSPWTPGSSVLEIADVITGSPAAVSGIRAGDVLLAIDGRAVAEIDPLDVEELLWGAPGGEVEVAIRRDGEEHRHRLTRRALLR